MLSILQNPIEQTNQPKPHSNTRLLSRTVPQRFATHRGTGARAASNPTKANPARGEEKTSATSRPGQPCPGGGIAHSWPLSRGVLAGFSLQSHVGKGRGPATPPHSCSSREQSLSHAQNSRTFVGSHGVRNHSWRVWHCAATHHNLLPWSVGGTGPGYGTSSGSGRPRAQPPSLRAGPQLTSSRC